ncbi:uncharacterized protein LOC142240773 [Haematobia irritans]|uniref:uncharacterized protein LOC142240773 n=1 Tax=Haematobia irritans TaxID=7368 RepID=UPI003F4F9862
MLINQIIALIIISLLHYHVESAQSRFNLEFYNYECIKVTSRIKIFECVFQKVSSNRFIFNERLMVDQDLNNKFEMRVWVSVRPRNGKKTIKFLDVHLNVCKIFAGSLENLLLRSLLNELRRSSNVPSCCPFKRNFLYQMNNFSFTDALLPLYTPLINFTFGMEFMEEKSLFAITRITGATLPRT